MRRWLSWLWILSWSTLGLPGMVAAEPGASPSPVPEVISTPSLSPSASPQPQQRTGSFRVGNRTPYPIRLVVLMRSGERVLAPERAHWDFAPGEGGSEGLLLSLGEEPLQISPGDVVIAFTIDGTRQYWGPNVVGESLSPFWNTKQQIWSMILQP